EDQARVILAAGIEAGLGARIHANQLTEGGGVRLAVELGAASADHCTHLAPKDIDALACSSTVATLLPGAEFSTRSPYPNARALLDAGATVALATDCNPGSSYTSSMPFCIALAVREMRMTPAEAVWSATAGGARALRRADVGHLAVGARPDLAILDAPSHLHLAYRPGVPLVHLVLLNGEPKCPSSSIRPASPWPTSLPSRAAPTASRSHPTQSPRWRPAARSSTTSSGRAGRCTACPPASARSRTRSSPRSAAPSCSTR